MAKINDGFFTDLAGGATWSAGVAFKRSNPLPLDRYSVFQTKALAEEYIATNAVAYPGQVIAVLEDGKMILYVINGEGEVLTLERVGIVPTGDGKTISVTDEGMISLLAADALIDEKNEAGEATGNKITNAGAQLILQSDGTLKWIQPDTSTAEGQATAIKGLQERMTTAEGDIDKLEGKVATLEGKEDKDTTYSVKEGEKVLSLDGTAFGTTLKIAYADNKIKLLGIDDAEISSFDASAFVADGVLENAEYDANTKKIIFTWNIVTGEDDEGNPIYKTDEVDISSLVDTYTAGNGITITNNEVAVKVVANDKYLEVDSTGLHSKGIDDAITEATKDLASKDDIADFVSNSALTEAIKDFATDKEVSDAVAAEAEIARAAEEANANAILAIKNDTTNTINSFADVVTALAGKQATGDYVLTDTLTEKVTELEGKITTAQNKGQEGVDNAATAQQKANDAYAKAETNAGNISALTSQLEAAAKVGSVNSGLIAGHETRITAAEGTIESITNTLLPAKADKSVVDGLSNSLGALEGTVGGHTTKLAALEETAQTKAQAEIEHNAIKALIGAPTKVEGETTTPATGVYVEIEKKADKASTLAGYGITDAYTKGETDSAIATAVANAGHLKRMIIDALPSTEIDTNTIYMVPTVGDSIFDDNIYDEYMYINGKWEKIGTTETDLTQYATKEYVDNAINDIPLATLTRGENDAVSIVAGLIKPVDKKFEVENGEVKKISTDLLINGETELILYGGNAGVS